VPKTSIDKSARDSGAQPQPDTGHLLEQQSYLDKGVDLVTGLVIKDEKLRHEVDHYAGELIKTTALFTRGKGGAIGTLALYGVASASPDTSFGQQLEDFTLGAARGGATRAVLNRVSATFKSAPTKGILTGVGSRAIDSIISHDTFTAPSKTMARLQNELLDPKTIAYDAVTWTLGEGLFKGANGLLKGSLSKNAMAGSVSMGASFGLVTGGSQEIVRQKSAGESFDLSKVVQKSLLEGLVTGVAGGAGHKLSPEPRILKGGSVNVTEGEVKTSSEVNTKGGQPGKVSDAASGVTVTAVTANREFVIDGGKKELPALHNKDGNLMLNVREVVKHEDGSEKFGPIQKLFVQKRGFSEPLHPEASKADLIVSSHPENLSAADKAKHVFPEAEGKVWLTTGKDNKLLLSAGDNPVSQWRKKGYVEPVRLDHGNVTLSVMAPLLVGEFHNLKSEKSITAFKEFDRQLAEAKKLGVDAVSTDVWWGVIEQSKGKFDWSYYDKLSDHVTKAGLKWVPILSFHQCGGNVGDDVSVPLPSWIWNEVGSKLPGGNSESAKYKSEQNHTSTEYVSLFADHVVMDRYASVMKEFQNHFAAKAKDIGEVNVSLGPAGELRYPSYNSHDQHAGYPTRGAMQASGELAQESFRKFVLSKYGTVESAGKAWSMSDLKAESIRTPSEADGFFKRGDHFNLQYGRDFFDWYNQSLIDHGKNVMTTALGVFGTTQSPFYGIDLGAKIPGVHWRVGEKQGDKIVLGDRLAELNAGLIRTSRGDWDRDIDGRGYRPLLSMFGELQPVAQGIGTRVVPAFTALEMADGHDGPAGKTMPYTLATWVGQEARRQHLFPKAENALSGNLYSGESWDRMKSMLNLPNQHGDYHGLTFLRMKDVTDNDVARAKMIELNIARRSIESIKQIVRNFLGKIA